MDIATTLPAEIWTHIFYLLTLHDIRRMMRVHRVFYIYSRPFIWRRLTLCSFDTQDRQKAEVVIRNPTLGQYVQELRLQPSNCEFIAGSYFPIDAPTSVWVASPPIRTWFDLLRRPEWKKHPMRSSRHFLLSKRELATALSVATHLTKLRTLSVLAWNDHNANPDPQLYHTLWSKIHTNHVSCLDFSLSLWSALRIFSGAIQKSQSAFPSLEMLRLHCDLLEDGSPDPELYEAAIKAIASVGRDLKSLCLSYMRGFRPLVAALFSGLGFFPKLVHLDFSDWSNGGDLTLLMAFINLHQSTLSHLMIGGYTHQLFSHLSQAPMYPSQTPQLTSLGLQTEDDIITSIGDPSLQPYANTLTTLVITQSWSIHGRSLSYQDLDKLTSSLSASPRGAVLRRLRAPIECLIPEIFDLLSNRLENLDSLSLMYKRLDTSTVDFWGEMKKKTYCDWKIERFYLTDRRSFHPTLGQEVKDIMVQVIPSIKDFDEGDWWNLRVTVPG